jgi:hypothetical protein
MSSVERYLLSTEAVEVQVRRHWASLAKSGTILVGLLVLGSLVIALAGSSGLLATTGMLLILGSLGWFGWEIADWRIARFVITDKRVLLVTGLLTQRVAIMPLTKVTDLTYERSVWGRLLGFGVFVVESAGQHQAFSRIEYLPSPELLYHQVSALLFGPRSRLPRLIGPNEIEEPPARRRRHAAGDGPHPDDQHTTPLPPFR